MNHPAPRARRFLKAAVLLLLAANAGAQEASPNGAPLGAPRDGLLPELRERAVVLSIITRVAENQQELLTAANSKVTLPGRPVSVKLEGVNVVMYIQFTPYLRDKGHNLLVAQGQIWVYIPNEGMSYKTTMQTIPLEFGEQIYFFPLGSDPSGASPRIELQIVLNRYEDVLKQNENAAPPEAGG